MPDELSEDWIANFRSAGIRDGKQAEFLVYDWFPWQLIEKIGVFNQNISDEVLKALAAAEHPPIVSVERGWYY